MSTEIFGLKNVPNPGAPGWLSRLSGSGHDLTVHEFKPLVGLCAHGTEPGACFRFVSLSLCPSPTCTMSLCLSLLKINKTLNFVCVCV